MPSPASTLTHLACSRCSNHFNPSDPQHLCSCGAPLLARYDLPLAARTFTLENFRSRPANMWRYAELLPSFDPISLGEGMTPLLHTRRTGARLGLSHLYVKDEGLNPTGSFKARGLSAAVTMARKVGARALAIPTAGNAGGALAAYAATAGIPAVIVMPADTPASNILEARAFGADVRLLPGLISDCGKFVADHKDREGWYDVSTLKEPYRIEGKKTMGLELWEQFAGSLPDVIIYPTGGGVGLIGMWKAFDELEALGLIPPHKKSPRPRFVVVQAAGCAPIVRAFEQHADVSQFWDNAATLASGLRVPKALGDFLCLRALRETSGAAVTATDDEMFRAARELAREEGIFAAPEGAATLVAAQKLLASGFITPADRVVLFNTGSGYKYSEAWDKALAL